MSWDGYRDHMLAGGHVSDAAICGIEGGVWSTNKDFNITNEEILTLVRGFGDASTFQANGVVVSGVKYMYLQSDDGQIQGKKKDFGGISIAKAGKCILIGHYNEGKQAGECRKQVERIRDYLVSAGY